MRVEVKARLDAMAKRIADQMQGESARIERVWELLRQQANYPKDMGEFKYTADTAMILAKQHAPVHQK